jgi:hypothetical protein
MEGIPWRNNSGDAEYQSQDSSTDAPVTIMMRTSLSIEVCSTCPSASRSVVATSDIFHPQGYEDGTDEDEAGQPDVMGNKVIIDIGGDSGLDQLGCQGPLEPCNEGAGGDEKQGEGNPSHKSAFLHLFDGMILHCK